MKIESGNIVVAILCDPREKVLGVLHEIDAAGIFLRGINLDYFDEWVTAIRNEEPYLPMQDYFFPMWRIERVTNDESHFEALSLAEQFHKKTGKSFTDF